MVLGEGRKKKWTEIIGENDKDSGDQRKRDRGETNNLYKYFSTEK